MENNVTIFYDSKSFPQAQQYAEVWNVYCNDLNYMLQFKEFKPTTQNYKNIYFACRDKDKFKDIIEGHKKFQCSFLTTLPDYRGKDVATVAKELRAKGLTEPFSDIAYEKKKKAYKEEVKVAEAKGKFLDPNPDEELEPGILYKPRRKHA